jgi:hypothetical protein
MAKKLGAYYHRYLLSRDKMKILTSRLKEVLGEEVDQLLMREGMTHPPFDPMRISRVGKAGVEFQFHPRQAIGFEASIEPSIQGFIIKVDDGLRADRRRRNRLRATMTHELMHAFFYDTNELPPRRLGAGESWHDAAVEEDVCRSLAREFLMPTFSLRRLMAERSDLGTASLRSLKLLKHIYHVSSELVAYKMIKELCAWNVIFIKCEKMDDGFGASTRLKATDRAFAKLKVPYQISAHCEVRRKGPCESGWHFVH